MFLEYFKQLSSIINHQFINLGVIKEDSYLKNDSLPQIDIGIELSELLNYDYGYLIALTIFLVLIIIIYLSYLCCRKVQNAQKVKAVKEFVVPSKGPRFRKRDRIDFVRRRIVRDAKAIGSYMRPGQGKKRRDMTKLLKRVFRSKDSPDLQSQMIRPNMPDDYLEEEGSIEGGAHGESSSVPDWLLLVLKNLRVFGHLGNSVLIEVMKHIEYVNLRKNENLFSVGDQDDNMYIVENGTIRVFYEFEKSSSMELKDVNPGEAVVSLISFIDYLGGKRENLKTISAKAIEDNTKVIKLTFQSFKEAFDKNPESLSRIVQAVMIRLQRVTLLALHQYLGLGIELIKEGLKEGPINQLSDLKSEDNAICPIVNNKVNDLDNQRLKELSSVVIKHQLGLDEDLTENDAKFFDGIEIREYEKGQVIIEEGTIENNYLLTVLSGSVQVQQKSVSKSEEEVSDENIIIHIARPGEILGQLHVLTAEPSFFTYIILEDAKIGVANGSDVRRFMRKHPKLSLGLAMSVINYLSPYVRSIDFALEWSLVESGKALYKQNSDADCTFVILSGRLRSVVIRNDGKREMVGEYGKGELTGIVETVMKTRRSTTVIAVRDTEVAKLPTGLLDLIKLRFPSILMRLIHLLGEKLQQSWSESPRSMNIGMSGSLIQHSPQSNFSTVAIISLCPQKISETPFTLELYHALNHTKSTIRLTKSYVNSVLGNDAFDKASDFRLSSWLALQEDKNSIVIYQCDNDFTPWTQLCIRHADVIFFLVDPESSNTVTSLEVDLENYSKRTRKDMIFLHKKETKYPNNTSLWLRNRSWINSHYHVKCPNRIFLKKSLEKMEKIYSRILKGPPPDIHSDFSRLARMVTGTSVGLVLGGGGARGISHVGMIKAILEANIPIDSVAGVSIGSFVGGLYCQEREMTNLIIKARRFSCNVSNKWGLLMDLTYPFTAYFTGSRFNDVIKEAFGERDIRDLWIPFFTITTDITEISMRIHDYGSMWRYVRSSMSLAGYMPPLCDPHDGHLLLDGGYVNNLPADIMRMRGAKHILAIDVGSQDDTDFKNYGDHLPGFYYLLRRLSPFHETEKIPSQADIQVRLAYLSCVLKLETVKNADYCDYIRPPIDKYQTMQFEAFEEIKDIGYYHGQTYFAGLQKAGLLRQISARRTSLCEPGVYDHHDMDSDSSFIDDDEEDDDQFGQLGPVSSFIAHRRKSGIVTKFSRKYHRTHKK